MKRIKFFELPASDQDAIKAYLKAERKDEYPTLSEEGLTFLKSFLGDVEKKDRIYTPEDFIRILTGIDYDHRIKTKIVIERLKNLDKKYNNIDYSWARTVLQRLLHEGRISGEKDPNYNTYVWWGRG